MTLAFPPHPDLAPLSITGGFEAQTAKFIVRDSVQAVSITIESVLLISHVCCAVTPVSSVLPLTYDQRLISASSLAYPGTRRILLHIARTQSERLIHVECNIDYSTNKALRYSLSTT